MAIAGHTFTLTPSGYRCTAYNSSKGQVCDTPWLHVRTCQLQDIGVTQGIAHHGAPTTQEYEDIRREVACEEKRIWDAIISMSHPTYEITDHPYISDDVI